MKRFVMLLALALGCMAIEAGSAFAAGPENPYCYECVARSGYMDCMHPVPSGHVSCIPYATNCSVGAQCGQALQQFRMTPDGSLLNSMLLDAELAFQSAQDADQLQLAVTGSAEAVLNCLGLVAARHYSPARSEQIVAQTTSMVI